MKNKDDAVTEALEKLKPVLSKVTFGSIIGYCSGAAAKTVGKAVAVLVGLSFIAVQVNLMRFSCES